MKAVVVFDMRPARKAVRELAALLRTRTGQHPGKLVLDAMDRALAGENFLSVESHGFRADGAWKTVVLCRPGERLVELIAAMRAENGDVAGKAGHGEVSVKGGGTSVTVGRVGEGGHAGVLPGEGVAGEGGAA